MALVIGIDQADQVPEHDAVLVAQSGTRQQHRRQGSIVDVNREPGGDQRGVAGVEHHWRVGERAQVEAGSSPGGVFGQWKFPAKARVEDLQLNLSLHG